MTVFRIDHRLIFPPAYMAEPDGLLGVGGDLSPERLVLAYSMGIFPWYSEGQPILWWSPEPRLVLRPGEIKVSRSLRQAIRSGRLNVTFDTDFEAVIRACAGVHTESAGSTWITEDMIEAYIDLHRMGLAHSVECRDEGGGLVGGLYGVSIGRAFFGESMFSLVSNASKASLVALARRLEGWEFEMIDCQVSTTHLLSMGAHEVKRRDFLIALRRAIDHPTIKGRWSAEEDAPTGS